MKTLNLEISKSNFVQLEMQKPCRRQVIAVNKIMANYGFDYYEYLQTLMDSYNLMKKLGLDENSNFEGEKAMEFTGSEEFVKARKMQTQFFSSEMALEMVKHIWVQKGGRYSSTLQKYGEAIADYYGENPEADLEGDMTGFFLLMQTATKASKREAEPEAMTPPKE